MGSLGAFCAHILRFELGMVYFHFANIPNTPALEAETTR